MAVPKIPDDPLSQFSLSVFRLNGLLTQCGDNVTKATGQSSARWQVLGRVAHGSRSVAQMARDMGYARQSVQRVADLLVSEGLAIYKDNESHKRSPLLQLTAKGESTLAEIYRHYQKWSKQVMSQINAAQLSSLATKMNNIGDIIERHDATDFNSEKSKTRK